jgi:hypothetical protein
MQDQIATLIRFDLILETIAAVIALVVSHYANRAFHLTGQKRLSDLSTGFLVLSTGMFSRVIGTIYFFVLGGVAVPEALTLMNLVIIASGVLRIMAYSVFAVATRHTRHEYVPQVALLMALPVLTSVPLEMVTIMVLIVVVLQTFVNYISVRNRYALSVFLGFLSLFLSHLLVLSAIESDLGNLRYIVSQVLQFLGLFAFVVLLRQVDKSE